jgi:hypothetical protein
LKGSEDLKADIRLYPSAAYSFPSLLPHFIHLLQSMSCFILLMMLFANEAAHA